MELFYVQVVAYNGKGRGSRIIKWATRGKASHLSLRFINTPQSIIDALIEAGIEWTKDHELEAIQFKGVIEHPFVKSENCTLYNFRHTRAQAISILNTSVDKLGCGYDWRGIGGFATRLNVHSTLKWFCSELVAYCLLKAGIVLLWTAPFKQAPETTLSSTLLIKKLEK